MMNLEIWLDSLKKKKKKNLMMGFCRDQCRTNVKLSGMIIHEQYRSSRGNYPIKAKITNHRIFFLCMKPLAHRVYWLIGFVNTKKSK